VNSGSFRVALPYPSFVILFISKSYAGRKHDFAIRKSEKPMPREALADSGKDFRKKTMQLFHINDEEKLL
jgi:hypothetical protein